MIHLLQFRNGWDEEDPMDSLGALEGIRHLLKDLEISTYTMIQEGLKELTVSPYPHIISDGGFFQL